LSIGESFESDSLAAYRAWCERRGSEPWVYATEHVDWASPRTWVGFEEIARTAAAGCLDAPDAPDALYCLSESYAMAVLAECARRGIDVPGDLMVATLSDRGLADGTKPPLTSLELHPRDLGTAAAEMLADLVEGTVTDPSPVTISTKVVPRASTARR
jgi:DNA-binding LacI/PurR family transcriptional regulator